MDSDIKKKLDLQGVACPLNFVKTKLALAALAAGDLLEVILDEGEAILHVPRSVKEKGHQVVQVENLGQTFRVVIRKG